LRKGGNIMRKITFYVSLITVVVFTYICLIPIISHAEPPGLKRGLHAHCPQRLYDVKTVKTISGTVKGIMTGAIGRCRCPKVIVTVETAKKEKLEVNLGPMWYFERQGFDIEEGDKVEVTGSDVTVAGKNLLLATKVIKGDSILELRDSDGIPYWIGTGRRSKGGRGRW